MGSQGNFLNKVMSEAEPKPEQVTEEENAEEEDEEEDWTDQFAFDVHLCVSKGKCCYSIDEVKEVEGGSFSVAISSEPQGEKKGNDTFTAEQIAELQKLFEEDTPADLEGNVFCTIEHDARYALQELQLVAKSGLNRTVPSHEQLNDRVATAFAELKEPCWSDLTGGDVFRYFVSLFNLETFEEDEVSAKWISDITAAVTEKSGGKVKVESVKDFPDDKGVSVVRDIRLEISDDKQAMYVQICPAVNGWLCFHQ